MHTLYIHLSGIVGLFAFVNQLVRYAPLDRTIVVGVASGVAIYVVLMMGEMIVRRIIDSQDAGKDAGGAAGKAAGNSSGESRHEPSASEPTAQAA